MNNKIVNTFRSIIALGVICLLTVLSQSAEAQRWDPSYWYDNGYTPAISLDYDRVVEAHRDGNGALRYRVGKLKFTKIEWIGGQQYDYGFAPSISISGARVVEAHQGYNDDLWYRVGWFGDNGQITWGNSQRYEAKGYEPSISSYGVTVVEVHVGNPVTGALFYRVGQVSGNAINWGPSRQFTNGWNPSVSLYGSTVVETHQGSYGDLWCRVGQVRGNEIIWGDGSRYTNGWNPSISISALPGISGINVMEVHEGTNGDLWCYSGGVSGSRINWTRVRRYDAGWNPAISSSGSNFVEAHYGGSYNLWCHTGAWF